MAGRGGNPDPPTTFGMPGPRPGRDYREGKQNSHTPDPKGSVDDGKRAASVLEVDASPPRAK